MRGSLIAIAGAFGLCASGCAFVSPSGEFVPSYSDTVLQFVEVDGQQFPYRIYVPSNYDRLDKTRPFPLVVGLHGAGGDENSYFTHKSCKDPMYAMAEERGYIFAAPAAPRKRMDLCAEVPYEVVKEVRKHWHVDPRRVYVTGFSKGGFTTYQVVAEYPELFAAAFPLVWMPISKDAYLTEKYGEIVKLIPPEEKAKALAKVPLKIFVGTRDKHTPLEMVEKDAATIREQGGEVELHVHDGGHGGYRIDWAYSLIYDWFDAHVKPIEEAPAQPKAQHIN